MKDLTPITLAVKSPQYLVVNPQSGITSLQDLVAKAKAAPSKYSHASVAVGSASHLTMQMFKSAATINITHVPYMGAGPAIADLLAGIVQMGYFVPGNVLLPGDAITKVLCGSSTAAHCSALSSRSLQTKVMPIR
jgi:tripartite-type tricarboxylate transporter receptor subunit TctC